jgi:hypothetical protein
VSGGGEKPPQPALTGVGLAGLNADTENPDYDEMV